MNWSKNLTTLRISLRAARRRSKIVQEEVIPDLAFQSLSITLLTQMSVSFAISQVMTCSTVTPCHHFDQIPQPMILPICFARIAIPMDTPQLIVHTQWMFSDLI